MGIPAIGTSITVNSDCSQCCPRRLRIFCCCCSVDEDQQEQIQKVSQQKIEEVKTSISVKPHHRHHKVKKKG
jgi:hypothetical protein